MGECVKEATSALELRRIRSKAGEFKTRAYERSFSTLYLLASEEPTAAQTKTHWRGLEGQDANHLLPVGAGYDSVQCE